MVIRAKNLNILDNLHIFTNLNTIDIDHSSSDTSKTFIYNNYIIEEDDLQRKYRYYEKYIRIPYSVNNIFIKSLETEDFPKININLYRAIKTLSVTNIELNGFNIDNLCLKDRVFNASYKKKFVCSFAKIDILRYSDFFSILHNNIESKTMKFIIKYSTKNKMDDFLDYFDIFFNNKAEKIIMVDCNIEGYDISKFSKISKFSSFIFE